MVGRPSALVCLTCQLRWVRIGCRRRHLSSSRSRRIATVAVGSLVDPAAVREECLLAPLRNATPLNPLVSLSPRTPSGNNSVRLREGADSLVRLRPSRMLVLDKSSNPSPPRPGHVQHSTFPKTPQLGAGIVPHDTFRANLRAVALWGPGYNDRPIRKVLRDQLLQCQWPKDVYKVFAVAMQRERTSSRLAILHEPLVRAIYRCRANVDDLQILSLIGCIVSRFAYAHLPVAEDLLVLGIKFAARTRSLEGMKRYLRALRERRIPLNSGKFRAIIAKCSIGWRGLGEIRNGRWRRSDLMQVMHGFNDCRHLQPGHQYHLGTFLDRGDWQYLHGWIAILARCRDVETLWKEWQLWKASDARQNPKRLASMHKAMTSKVRGDQWFVEQFAHAGGLHEAWTIIQENNMQFCDLNQRTQLAMLDAIEPGTICDDSIRQALLLKYDVELRKIEAALGVSWIPADLAAGNLHVPNEDPEVVLERLAAPDWKLEPDFGYPLDSKSDAEKSREKALHTAEERGLAS